MEKEIGPELGLDFDMLQDFDRLPAKKETMSGVNCPSEISRFSMMYEKASSSSTAATTITTFVGRTTTVDATLPT